MGQILLLCGGAGRLGAFLPTGHGQPVYRLCLCPVGLRGLRFCRWPGDQKPQIIPLREVLLRFSFLKITRTNVSRETFLSFAFYGEEKILRRCYTKSGFLGEVHYGSDPYWFIFGGAAPREGLDPAGAGRSPRRDQ